MLAVVMEVGGYLQTDIATCLRSEISKSVKIVAVLGVETILYSEFDTQID